MSTLRGIAAAGALSLLLAGCGGEGSGGDAAPVSSSPNAQVEAVEHGTVEERVTRLSRPATSAPTGSRTTR